MRLAHFGHACVRIQDGDRVLVIPLAAELGEGAVAIATGETFTAAGFTVKAVGGVHAEVIDGLPGCPNLGFIVDGLYHPGDSLFVPADEVDTLLVPAAGPWVKIGEAITFVRSVRPARAFPIHDIQLSKVGLEYFDTWLEEETDYARIPVGRRPGRRRPPGRSSRGCRTGGAALRPPRPAPAPARISRRSRRPGRPGRPK